MRRMEVLFLCRCVCRRTLHTAVKSQISAVKAASIQINPIQTENEQLGISQLSKASLLHTAKNNLTALDLTDLNTASDIPDNVTMGCPLRSQFTDTSEKETKLADAKHIDTMPGPRGLPWIGNAIKYSSLGPYKFEKILDNRLTYKEKYGTIYREKLGKMDIVHIFEPSDVAKMFRLEGKYPSRGTIANLEVTYLKRNNKLIGFAFLDGEEWARQKGIIQKIMMHPTAAARYLHMQTPVVADFVDYLHSKRDSNGVVVDLYEDLFKYTMEAIGVVCFDERLGTFSENSSMDARRLSTAISETFYCFRQCMFAFPWYQYARTPMYKRFERAANDMREIMGRHVQKIAEKVRKDGLLKTKGMCPFALALLEEDRSMFEVLMQDDRVSNELAVNLIMALFRTGIDSTGNALAFFLYNLANNPEKQQLLHEEIQNTLPNNQPLTVEAIAKMPYLKAALRESFRLHFPVFGGSGRVMPHDVVFSGYNVPQGTFIFANMAAMSRLPEYFPEPEEYIPERWLRDDRAIYQTTSEGDQGFLSLPFSAGMRACPGKRFAEQGLYLAAVTILQKFKLDYQGDEMGMIHMPFTTPDRPLNIKFTPR